MFLKNFFFIKKSSVKHGFFTSLNGLSKREFKSLNCSNSNNDDKKIVLKNRMIALKNLNLDKKKLILIRQSHSSRVIRINENNVFVAVGDNFPPPTFAMYYWEGASNNTLPFLACLIWPITIIGGTIWGIRTDRKPLAYGILTWGIVAMLAVFLFTFLWFVGW